MKYENIELHDEKNNKIDLLHRTKKRVNNTTNDTYKKNVNNASKINEKKDEIRTRVDDKIIICTKKNLIKKKFN